MGYFSGGFGGFTGRGGGGATAAGGGAVSVEITGIKEVAAALRALPAKMRDTAIKPALEAGAAIILSAAERKVARKSGRTQESLKVVTTGSGKKMVVSVVCDQAWPYVGLFLEKGTQNHFGAFGERVKASNVWRKEHRRLFSFGSRTERMPPHPFMQPALDEAGPGAAQFIVETLARNVEALAGNSAPSFM
jgi:HK97 gp10 family phage protein